ncbi:MAG TPA: hypothetical protein VLE97_10620 [Gaiellaceae bacterium]|nr:hypothetical protein [Gaiellaceae bacterium]
MSHRRFIVVDLGEQLESGRRFAVWDREVERFWKINNHQTWLSVRDLVADFRAKDRPEPRFAGAYRDQEEELTMLATIAGFDLDV